MTGYMNFDLAKYVHRLRVGRGIVQSAWSWCRFCGSRATYSWFKDLWSMRCSSPVCRAGGL